MKHNPFVRYSFFSSLVRTFFFLLMSSHLIHFKGIVVALLRLPYRKSLLHPLCFTQAARSILKNDQVTLCQIRHDIHLCLRLRSCSRIDALRYEYTAQWEHNAREQSWSWLEPPFSLLMTISCPSIMYQLRRVFTLS